MDDFYFEEEEKQSDSGLDLRRFWKALLRKWWLWGGIAVVITVPWVLHVKQEKPIYEAQATIQFSTVDGGTDANLVSRRWEELTSRSFAEEVVADLGLVMELQPIEKDTLIHRREVFEAFSTTENPETGSYALRFPGDGTFAVYRLGSDDRSEQKLHSDKIINAQLDTVSLNGFHFILSSAPQYPPEIIFHVRNFRHSVASFQNQIDVSFNRVHTLMYIKLQDSDPFLVMQKTNKLAEIFVEKSQSVKRSGTRRQFEVLRAQLKRAQETLKNADRKLTAFRTANVGVGTGSSEADRLGQKLARVEARRDELLLDQDNLKALLDQATSVNNEDVRRPSTARSSLYRELSRLDVFKHIAQMAVLRDELTRLEQQYSDIVANSSWENDRAIELAKQIADVHTRIDTIAKRQNKDLTEQIRRLNSEINELERQLRNLPAKESEYAELVREKENAQEIYNELNARFATMQLTQDIETEEIRILDPAIVPEFPINGNKKAKAVMGLVTGLLLGVGVVLAIEFLDKSVRTVEDVKKHLKINVLGSIPEVNFAEAFDYQDDKKIKMIDNQLVTHDYSPTPIGEAYRSLRTNILFSKDVGRVQTIVITSMAPGDGKSFTSANLAITMAQQKSNTLLIDTDLRRGVQHNTFGLPKEPGFSNFLTGSLPLPEIINETHIPNLSVISCGSLVPNPSELLGSHQMQRFLDEVRRRFDLVIFDTPPLNAATDAVVIGTQVDASIIVIRAGKTHREVARQKMELYQHIPAKVMGVILNGTDVDLAHEGYSYYHY